MTASDRPTDSATSPLTGGVANPRREIDVFERQLFGVFVIETKARRTAEPPCPDCGRRGYHVKVCARRSLLDAGAARADGRAITELELRWIYIARVQYSQGSPVRFPDTRRGAPRKLGGASRSR